MCDPLTGICKIDFSALGADVEADQPKLNIEVVNPQEAEGVLRNAESGNVKPLFKYFGADWCPDCVRVKKYCEANKVPFLEFDTDKVGRPNIGKSRIPTLVFDDGSFLQEPSVEELEAKLKSLDGGDAKEE